MTARDDRNREFRHQWLGKRKLGDPPPDDVQFAVIAAENAILREACREALLFLTAPAHSPRLWPTSRGNLAKMLERAIGEAP
jgi:hypothetical protein